MFTHEFVGIKLHPLSLFLQVFESLLERNSPQHATRFTLGMLFFAW